MYIDNKVFMELIAKYKETGDKKYYEKIGKNFLLMCKNLMRRPCFLSYSKDRQDGMISNALLNMTKYLPNFRLDYIDNPFGFFTRIAINAFVQRINYFNKLDSLYKSIGYIEVIENQDI
jgi:DNA-directed RNA polymerase specialized sigma24 family protein